MICVYCGERATCIDHIRPKTRGGTEDDDNKVPCCQPCNSSKHNLLITEWDSRRVLYAIAHSTKVYRELIRLSENLSVSERLKISACILRIPPHAFVNLKPNRIDRIIHGEVNITKGLSLRDIAEMGIIPISYAALRKAKQRDISFPLAITDNGRACLYDADEIVSWYNSRPSNLRPSMIREA